jgi:hypothetical protein
MSDREERGDGEISIQLPCTDPPEIDRFKYLTSFHPTKLGSPKFPIPPNPLGEFKEIAG